jgi:hypothetical protein
MWFDTAQHPAKASYPAQQAVPEAEPHAELNEQHMLCVFAAVQTLL